jgi:hypothetical protein
MRWFKFVGVLFLLVVTMMLSRTTPAGARSGDPQCAEVCSECGSECSTMCYENEDLTMCGSTQYGCPGYCGGNPPPPPNDPCLYVDPLWTLEYQVTTGEYIIDDASSWTCTCYRTIQYHYIDLNECWVDYYECLDHDYGWGAYGSCGSACGSWGFHC